MRTLQGRCKTLQNSPITGYISACRTEFCVSSEASSSHLYRAYLIPNTLYYFITRARYYI